MGKFLSLIIKVTRRCNLRCRYCNDWKAESRNLSFEATANVIAKALRQSKASTINFIWHGGEPLLRGKEFFQKAVYLQDQLREDKKVINSLQSNGSLIDDSWLHLFEECNFSIGLSMDGPSKLHDRQRLTRDGRGSHATTMAALKKLKESEISFGVLIVVSPRTLEYGPDRMFEFLMQNDIKNVAFLPMRPETLPDAHYDSRQDYVNDSRFVPYMKKIFDLWFELDDPTITIRQLNSIMDALMGGTSSVCTMSGDCIGYNFGINTNGDLYHCDRYVNDRNYYLGNILNTDFDQLWESKKLENLITADKKRLENCQDCRWFQVCKGGCPHDMYIAQRSDIQDKKCSGKKELFQHIHHKLCQEVAN